MRYEIILIKEIIIAILLIFFELYFFPKKTYYKGWVRASGENFPAFFLHSATDFFPILYVFGQLGKKYEYDLPIGGKVCISLPCIISF